MKTAAVIFIILSLLLTGAGIFYFASYQPKRYAGAVLEFYKESSDDYQLLFQASLQEAYDYEGGLNILARRDKALSEMKDTVSALNPPAFGKGKQLQTELEGFLIDLKEILAEAENSMTFLVKAAAFQDLFQPGQAAFPDPNRTTMGDLARYMDRIIPEMKDRGSELFKNSAPKLSDASEFTKLQSSWRETEPALTALRAMAHRLDPNMSLSGFPVDILTPQEQSATRKMENFQRLLGETLRTNSANDILLYGFLTTPGMVPPQIAERSERIGKAMGELQKKYGK